jgi:hypothetical protein
MTSMLDDLQSTTSICRVLVSSRGINLDLKSTRENGCNTRGFEEDLCGREVWLWI